MVRRQKVPVTWRLILFLCRTCGRCGRRTEAKRAKKWKARARRTPRKKKRRPKTRTLHRMFRRTRSTVTPVQAERDIHAQKTATQQNVAFLSKPRCGRKGRENGEAMPGGEACIMRFVGRGGRHELADCHDWPVARGNWSAPKSCLALANRCGQQRRWLSLRASSSQPQARLFPALTAKFD